MVLQGNQGECEAGSLVEEEQQGHIETLDGADGFTVHEVGHATVVHAVVVHAEQGVVHAEPVVVVLVNALTTDLELNILQQLFGAIECVDVTYDVLCKYELHHDVGDQITVAGDLSGHLVAVANGTVDGLLDGLNGEVGVTTVHGFEEGNLGVTGEVHVLGTVSDEL